MEKESKLQTYLLLALGLVVFGIPIIFTGRAYDRAVQRADRDLRADRIAQYDESVNNWLGEGRVSLPAVEVFRGAMTQDGEGGGGIPLNVDAVIEGLSKQLTLSPVTDDMHVLYGRLDDEGKDYKNYAKGFVLGADLFRYTADGIEYPGDTLVLNVTGQIAPDMPRTDIGFSIPVHQCEIRKGDYCDGSGDQDACRSNSKSAKRKRAANRGDFYYAKISWLRSVTLTVAPTSDARDAEGRTVWLTDCGWEHFAHQKRADGSEDDKRMDKRSSAERWCEENYIQGPARGELPVENWESVERSVKVYLRSVDDPFTAANHITSCTEQFGKSSGRNKKDQRTALTWLIVSAIPLGLIVGLLACAGLLLGCDSASKCFSGSSGSRAANYQL